MGKNWENVRAERSCPEWTVEKIIKAGEDIVASIEKDVRFNQVNNEMNSNEDIRAFTEEIIDAEISERFLCPDDSVKFETYNILTDAKTSEKFKEDVFRALGI